MNHESFPRTLQQLLLSWSQRMKKWRSPSKPSNSSRRPVLGAKEPTPIRFLEQQLDTGRENRMHSQGRTGQLAFFFVDFLELLFEDRKSTRLNSSHVSISYAVFCLKKK